MSGGVSVTIPGRDPVEIVHLVLDLNGTLTNRGVLIDGVGERVVALGATIDLHLLSADTFGGLAEVALTLGLRATAVESGERKAGYVRELGASRCAAIGNGENDGAMLETATLGIAVIGPEGAAASAIRAADIVCLSILDALDLLLDDRALVATLRR